MKKNNEQFLVKIGQLNSMIGIECVWYKGQITSTACWLPLSPSPISFKTPDTLSRGNTSLRRLTVTMMTSPLYIMELYCVMSSVHFLLSGSPWQCSPYLVLITIFSHHRSCVRVLHDRGGPRFYDSIISLGGRK